MHHFADRVLAAIRHKKTPAMVGLDPRPEWLPRPLWQRHGLGPAAAERIWARAVEEFCSRVLDVVAPLVPAVKVQSAFFELLGAPGIQTLGVILRKARHLGLVTILDAKRADIGSTSEAYAQAAFGNPAATAVGMAGPTALADALTVNPYLGKDSLGPFLKYAQQGAHGVFVLVRTSNPGSVDVQQLTSVQRGRPVYAEVAEWVREWSDASLGTSGYGSVGGVVGATAGEQLAELRRAMPRAVLLMPGYGSQGAKAADVAPAFDPQGIGVLVNSSRAVLFPEPASSEGAGASVATWEQPIEQALRRMIADLAEHTPAGKLV
jgi:orotidine-5'-phosphate decarboxylase